MSLDELLAVISVRVREELQAQTITLYQPAATALGLSLPWLLLRKRQSLSRPWSMGLLCQWEELLQARGAGRQVASGDWYVYQRGIKRCVPWGDAATIAITLASGAARFKFLECGRLQLSYGTFSYSSSQPSQHGLGLS